MNNIDLVRAMRANVPVKLAFNNQERLENFAGRVGSEIEADSLSLLKAIKDSTFMAQMASMKTMFLLCLFRIPMRFIGILRQKNSVIK